MANERVTEDIFREKFGIKTKDGKGYIDGGHVYSQGVTGLKHIDNILKAIGGKPKEQNLDDLTKITNGVSKPEFIITIDDDSETICIVECKASDKDHVSKNMNKPAKYAVDGVLYYAKHFCKNFNVIAIAVSGTDANNMKVTNYYIPKGRPISAAIRIELAENKILPYSEIKNKMVREDIKKQYDMATVNKIAQTTHNLLRTAGLTERQKPLFVAGMIIASKDETFRASYNVPLVLQNVKDSKGNKIELAHKAICELAKQAIGEVLKKDGITDEKIVSVKNIFDEIAVLPKYQKMAMKDPASIESHFRRIIEEILPMMNESASSLDMLAAFYHEFLSYTKGDGQGLGIVLTPNHITEFMCKLAGVNKNTKVLDITCGSGSFLVSALTIMFDQSNSEEERNRIRRENIYGVEMQQDLYNLAICNMIMRQDGKSHLYHDDCFNEKVVEELREANIDIALINPPYSLKEEGRSELHFIQHALEIVKPGGLVAAIVPISSAIGTKEKTTRENLFSSHTLLAVMTMPEKLFGQTASVPTCIMLWKARKAHDPSEETFISLFKEDGHANQKNRGRVDKGNWKNIEQKWLNAYKNKIREAGFSMTKSLNHDDEWLAEAYIETDYSKITMNTFKKPFIKMLIEQLQEEIECQ